MLVYPKDWVLSDLKSKLNSAFWLMPATPTYVHYGVPYITSKNIKDGKINFLNSDKITYADYYKVSNLRKIEHNDILITMIGTIGEIGIVDSNLNFYGQNIYLIRPNKQELDSNFFYYLFNLPQNKESILNNKGGSTQGYLRADSVIEKKYYFPNINEQKAIAETLMAFDRHIENLESLIEKKKMVRDGTIEDLMSGKTRLDGFEDEWEKVSFNDIIGHLKSGLSRELKNEDIGIPVVRANNIDNGFLYLDRDIKYWYNEDPKGVNINNFLIQKDDILVNFINSKSKMGTTAIVKNTPKRKTIYTTNILRMRVKKFLNPKFIFYITFTEKYKSYIKDISKIAVNQASFTTVDYKKFECKIPADVKEQEAIASILTSMDEEIENLEKEKAKIKKIKVGAMDDLLTGRVRLI